MPGIKMVVGLGNPGDEYVDTRHNVGFRVIDSLSEKVKIEVRRKRFGAVLGIGEFADRKLILMKPGQFMNCSGRPVAKAAGFYKLDIRDLLVVTDDMALEPGRIRVRAKGSAGGHNGLADIIEELGTTEFDRLRVGIGQSNKEDAVDFVLDSPTEAERMLLDEAIGRARDAVLCWIEYGIDKAMNGFN
jgi:PTH1 family peptidyl-tRNA hydrolase